MLGSFGKSYFPSKINCISNCYLVWVKGFFQNIKKNSEGVIMLRIKISLILLLVVSWGSNLTVNASQYKDYDNPISFMVETLMWDDVNDIIPNKSKFTIIDLETGFKFQVQRRAGSKHADVQPLTKQDTEIMKQIYVGKWSWKRRAILVLYKDHLIAASMHGMPHGAGAIRNGFPGHFCVHFLGSTTHRKQKADMSHHLMILKAGGELEKYLNKVDPQQLMNVFITAINQEDQSILNYIISSTDNPFPFHKSIIEYNYIELLQIPGEEHFLNKDINVVPLKVKIFKKDGTTEKRLIQLMIKWDALLNRWMIDGENLANELRQ